jgi:hypothetical protein
MSERKRRTPYTPEGRRSQRLMRLRKAWRILQSTQKIVAKTIKYSVVTVLSIIGLNFVLLQLPIYQTFLLGKALDYVSEKTGFQTTMRYIYIDIQRTYLTIEDFYLRDLQGDTLIYVEALQVDFSYTTLLQGGDITLEDVKLKEATVNLVTHQNTKQLNINEFVAQINALFSSDKPKDPNKKPVKFMIKQGALEDCHFRLYSELVPEHAGDYFDPQHFGVDQLNGRIRDLKVAGDTVRLQVIGLGAVEPQTKLRVKQLDMVFFLTKQTMQFNRLYLEANNTILRKSINFHYKHTSELADFVDKVTIVADLDQTVIDTDDLAIFAPVVKPYADVWRFDGRFKGRVGNFILQDFEASLGEATTLRGEAYLKGLPDMEQFYLQATLQNSQLLATDLYRFLEDPTPLALVANMGQIGFDATYEGTLSDFKTQAKLQTAAGSATADLQMNLRTQTYQTQLQTQALDLGTILGIPMVGGLTMAGDIKGKGFSAETADVVVNGQIGQLQYNGYNYEQMVVQGHFKRNFFEGTFEAQDPNLDLTLRGEINFAQDPSAPTMPQGKFDLITEIRHIDLQPLNFTPKPAIIEGLITAEMYGLTLDSLLGTVIIEDANLLYDNKGLEVGIAALYATRSLEADNRVFGFASDYAEGKIDGNFKPSQLIEDLQTILGEYFLLLQNRSDTLEKYYTSKNKPLEEATKKGLNKITQKQAIAEIEPYRVVFDLHLKNINQVLYLFSDQFELAKDARFGGTLSVGEKSVFSMYTRKRLDYLIASGQRFEQIDLQLYTEKDLYSRDVLAEGTLFSANQTLAGVAAKNMLLEFTWFNNRIDFNSHLYQDDSTQNSIQVEGELQFLTDSMLLHFATLDLRFLDERWSIDQQNQVLFTPTQTHFFDTRLYNRQNTDAQVAVKGFIDRQENDTLYVLINSLDLGKISSVTGTRIGGLVDADLELHNPTVAFDVEGELYIENVMIEEFLVGDVSAQMAWDNEETRLLLEAVIEYRNRKLLNLEGTIDIDRDEIDIKAKLGGLPINLAEPFARGLVSQMQGSAVGNLHIGGSLSAPVILGEANILNGALTVDYLNTRYRLGDEKIVFDVNAISFQNLKVIDQNEQAASVRGGIYHDSFRNILVDVKANYRNFLLLNKPEDLNELFFGTARATGQLIVSGFLDNLRIEVNARNERGTRIAMPLFGGYQQVEQKEYILFADPVDTDSTQLLPKKIDLGGLNLVFNLEVTPEARFEIIFDKQAGDIIRGAGNGKIQMEVTPDGDFKILGDYTITEGKYNFTLLNLVNKGFDIRRGSRITFNSDVFDTQLDITAVYPQRVTLSPLIDLGTVPDPENVEYRQKFQVDVLLALKGKMLEPEIALDIDLQRAYNTPNISLRQAVADLDSRVKVDEQERNKQVFSLIVLKRLASPNAFIGMGSAASGSLSELLSNQLSAWVSQVDENLELNLDLDASQLSVSYNLFNSRLKITREGSLSANQSQSELAAAVGDWTIEYMLTNDGKLRAKAYNRMNFNNPLGSINLSGNASTTAGFSLMYTQSFDRFWDIFRKRPRKKREISINKADE